MAIVRIYVITYRRPKLLERALHSLLNQDFGNWVAEVMNDDPLDQRVDELVASLSDPRIQMTKLPLHRGGTGNFNYAFQACDEQYASILEDDNWWESNFLTTMLKALEMNSNILIACSNEHIWKEQKDGSWLDTGNNIWHATKGVEIYNTHPIALCGTAKICNSSLMFRTKNSGEWLTPESIPVDVTEPFRERVIPSGILLIYTPLANYSVTVNTFRSEKMIVAAGYELLLIGSVFALTKSSLRKMLAEQLLFNRRIRGWEGIVGLLRVGYFFPEARAIWQLSKFSEKLRFILANFRRPSLFLALWRFKSQHESEWSYLTQGPVADLLRNREKL